MTEAYIFDAVRTRAARVKKDGSLHQATRVAAAHAAAGACSSATSSTPRWWTMSSGLRHPGGRAGPDIARTAVLDAGWAQTVAGVTLSRFCASGLEAVNLATAKIMSGMEDMVVAGGVESMSRWAMGSDGGAWVMDPRVNSGNGLRAPGHQRRSHRHAGRLWPPGPGCFRPSRTAVRAGTGRRAVWTLGGGGHGHQWHGLLDRDETVRPGTSVESLAKLNPSFEMMGAMGF